MLIRKVDPFTGKENTREIDVTDEQINAWWDGELIQDAMPNLTPSEREFIMTGITDESWDTLADGDEQ